MAALLGTGCSVVLDSSASQCDTNEECQALGPEFAGHVCSENVCVLPTEATCSSSQECIDLLAAPAACTAGSCVPLTSEDCQQVVPQEVLGDDNTIYFGWMGPLQDDYESIGVPMKQASVLAFQEILERANGLPGGSGGVRRKLGLIACHSLEDPDRTARHLVEAVGVPGIIGPAFSGVTLSVATDIAIPGGTLLMSASATTPAISDLQDENLVWRTCPSDAIQAIPLAALVTQAEARIRTEQSIPTAETIRLATASKGDAYGSGLFDSLTELMIFNGQSASDNGADFLPTSYPDPSSQTVDFSEVVNDIVDFAPHIVIPLGTNEGVTDIMQGVEDAWPTVGTPPPRPTYLFPDGGRIDELLEATQGNEDLRLRVKGTAPGRQSDLYDEFRLRYRQAYDNETPGIYTDTSYDAAYLLAYGVVAAGEDPLTGSSLASGLMKLSSGPDIEVGPNRINDALAALSGGGDIDFDGASGSLDFDNALGEAEADIDIWCVVVDNQTSETVFYSSGQYYDAALRQISGVDGCY
ncbi:MAG: ABC transporter substrate-binding protein [Deltaproteobacteria bacterium]|nr:ABC transporter substrate-binding protein [Deltaproteobacteria bacterium]MBW2531518.1 ABC transporter substrate-binding protein [Deltaproteobacteria bacterium]